MASIKKCEWCGKEFFANSNAKTCSNNCRAKFNYHKRNQNSKIYQIGLTIEEKREKHNRYNREKYKNDEKYREYMKIKRKERYLKLYK